jgi:DNA-binding MarR family transcriptional regulator
VTESRTLGQTMAAVNHKTAGMAIDFEAMRAVSNIHRAATAIRNHLEQSVLKSVDLTWTAFVVLWVVWTWEEMETRHVAAEAGITKGTLTGVANTLVARGLLHKESPAHDRRRVMLSLTPEGEELMTLLFPAFNDEERFVTATLDTPAVRQLGASLRAILEHLEASSRERQAAIVPIQVHGHASRGSKRAAGARKSV